MKGKLLLLALLVTTLQATPLFAQVRGGAFTASLFEGGYTFDGIQHLKTNVAHGVRLGYNLNGNWGIEGQFTYVPLKSTLADDKGDLYSLRGDLLHHFMPESRLVPFVALGGGWSKTDGFFGNNEDGTVDYGAGLKYFLTDWVALRGDVRHILSFHTSNYGGSNNWSNYEYTAGLTFQIGGTRTAAPAVAVEKPVTVAEAPRPEPQVAPAPVLAPVAKPVPEPVTVKEDAPPSPVPLAESAPAAAAAEKAAPVKAQLPVPVVPVPQVAEAAGDCNGCKVNSICNVVIGSEGVEIISDLGIETYKVFKLSAPTRLVIDICCATYGSNGKLSKFAVNRMGVSSVRVGTHPGKLRVVIDSPLAKFPAYRVEKTERGLNLLLTEE
jgi:outer membrane beta-barrel protein